MTETNAVSQPSQKLRFRNYKPRDKKLAKCVIESKAEAEITEVIEALIKESESEESLTLVPRKVNWDLKRDIQPKLDRLEALTHRALVEMLREQLKEEGEYESDDE